MNLLLCWTHLSFEETWCVLICFFGVILLIFCRLRVEWDWKGEEMRWKGTKVPDRTQSRDIQANGGNMVHSDRSQDLIYSNISLKQLIWHLATKLRKTLSIFTFPFFITTTSNWEANQFYFLNGAVKGCTLSVTLMVLWDVWNILNLPCTFLFGLEQTSPHTSVSCTLTNPKQTGLHNSSGRACCYLPGTPSYSCSSVDNKTQHITFLTFLFCQCCCCVTGCILSARPVIARPLGFTWKRALTFDIFCICTHASQLSVQPHNELALISWHVSSYLSPPWPHQAGPGCHQFNIIFYLLV